MTDVGVSRAKQPGWLSAAPLVPLVIAFVAGIAAESYLRWPGWAYPTAVVALLAGWAALRRASRAMPLRLAALWAVAFVLGAWRMGLDRHALEPDHVALAALSDRPIITVRGEVATRPILRRHQVAEFIEGSSRDPNASFALRLTEIRRGAGPWQPAAGMVSARCAGPGLSIEPGRHIEATGILRPILPPSNPGERDYRQRSHDRRLFASLWLPSDRPAMSGRPGSAVAAVVDRFRLAGRALLLGEPEALNWDDQLLLDDLILGREGEGAEQLIQPFLRTGTYHVLAISGLHMAVLAGVTWLVLRMARVRPRRSAAVVLAIVIAYCLMAQASPPVLRSGIMVAVMCIGVLLRRQGQALTALAAAALLLTGFAPGAIFEAGFQLSFIVVLGMVLFSDPSYRWLHRLLLRAEPGEAGRRWPVLADRPLVEAALRTLIAAVAVSAVAWVVGLPLMSFYFRRFYPWAMVCSLALAIPVWAALSLSFAKMLLSLVAPAIGAWLNGPLHVVSDSVLSIVNALDRLPGMSFTTAAPTGIEIAVFYAYLLSWRVRPSWLSRRGLLAVGAAAACGLVLLRPPGGSHDGGLDIAMLNIGDGQCCVVRGADQPAGEAVLIDCGSASRSDVTEDVLLPALAAECGWFDRLAVRAAFVSHDNLDHYSGLPALVRRGLLGEVIVSPAMMAPGRSGGAELAGGIGRALTGYCVPVRPAAAGAWVDLGGGASAELLWPPPGTAHVSSERANDTSQVVRVSFAGRRVLFSGDIGELPERRLLAGAAGGQIDLRADVLVMPHHGAMIASTDAFVRAVDPATVIVSSRRVVEDIVSRCAALRDPGRRALTTGQCGAVRVRIDRDGSVRVTSAHSRR